MPESDLVLLHAPSVYDFRQEAMLYGPIADLAPVPFVFEVCPLGYLSLANYLEQAGYRVYILNLARCMLSDPQFDTEEAIAALDPVAFGIDLHWLTQAQGALAVAQIVKALHPETPIILGGFAATYYHQELMEFPQVDYVLRGDSTEDALLHLMECLCLGRVPDLVAGLTWRTRSGHVVKNPSGPLPPTLDDLSLGDHLFTARPDSCPTVIPMVRGCTRNCLTCNNSAFSCQRLHGREKPSYRSPELLARDLHTSGRRRDGVAYVPCDITQPGMDYAYRFLQAVKGFPGLLYLDLLQPTPRKFLKDVFNAVRHVAIQIFLGSHDIRVRQAIGKNYSNLAIEQTIADVLELGCERLDLHFTIGLPHQDYASVMSTIAYCDSLLNRFGDGRLHTFVAPLAPFLEPGSLAFEEPEQHGYRLLLCSLEQHRKALLAPTWKYVLNYETEWMTRDDIVRASYDATIGLAHLRAKHGLISVESAQALEANVVKARRLMAEIDKVLSDAEPEQVQDTLRALKQEIDEVNHVVPWNGHLATFPVRARQRLDPAGPTDVLTNPRRVWRWVSGWWGNRRNCADRTAENHLADPHQGGIPS